jgi:DNA-binding MarR family transcriptional regulator
MNEGLRIDPLDSGAFSTVRLSSRDVRDASRILASLIGYEIVPDSMAPGDVRLEPTRRMMVQRAKTTFLNRQRRRQIFGSDLFGEPGWDMLLALYVTEDMGPRNTVGRVVAFSGVSPTTALRWLDTLEARKFIERTPHPTDKRTALILLTEHGRASLDAYFSEPLADDM